MLSPCHLTDGCMPQRANLSNQSLEAASVPKFYIKLPSAEPMAPWGCLHDRRSVAAKEGIARRRPHQKKKLSVQPVGFGGVLEPGVGSGRRRWPIGCPLQSHAAGSCAQQLIASRLRTMRVTTGSYSAFNAEA